MMQGWKHDVRNAAGHRTTPGKKIATGTGSTPFPNL